ncbi:MAG: hypothetical protein J0J15_37830, partial [Mesorhizobium sp.]|nr:hypothetical protein [Mesorhizobium sp.]
MKNPADRTGERGCVTNETGIIVPVLFLARSACRSLAGDVASLLDLAAPARCQVTSPGLEILWRAKAWTLR